MENISTKTIAKMSQKGGFKIDLPKDKDKDNSEKVDNKEKV
jgi:hypothetical protein